MVVRISGFFVRSEAGKLMAVSFLGVSRRRVAAAQVSHDLAPMVTRLCFKRLKSAAFRVIIGREWRRAAEVPAPVVYSRRQIMSSEMLYFGKLRTKGREMAKTEPSVDQWLREAKADPAAAQCGMFLTHNGVVRITPRPRCAKAWKAWARWWPSSSPMMRRVWPPPSRGAHLARRLLCTHLAERGALRGGRFAHVRAHRRRYPPQLHRRAAEARGSHQE
mgnify:CR=1 FL=1